MFIKQRNSTKRCKFFIDNKKTFLYKEIRYADIAQLVEQLICNQRVGSSSLSVGTIENKMRLYGAFLFLKLTRGRISDPLGSGSRIKNTVAPVFFTARDVVLLLSEPGDSRRNEIYKTSDRSELANLVSPTSQNKSLCRHH